MTKHWRANAAMVLWIVLFALAMATTQVPYVAPLSFVVVVLIAWDYGFRLAMIWIAVVHVLMPCTLYLLGIGPFVVFAEAGPLLAVIMTATFITVTVLAYLTDRVRALTRELRESRSALQRANEDLKTALNEVKELRGLLPICSWCKQIRDPNGEWESVEIYISRHSRATFTHGLCPACLEKQLQALK